MSSSLWFIFEVLIGGIFNCSEVFFYLNAVNICQFSHLWFVIFRYLSIFPSKSFKVLLFTFESSFFLEENPHWTVRRRIYFLMS